MIVIILFKNVTCRWITLGLYSRHTSGTAGWRTSSGLLGFSKTKNKPIHLYYLNLLVAYQNQKHYGFLNI